MKKSILLLVAVLAFSSCSKDNEPKVETSYVNPYPVENFLNSYLEATGFNQKSENQISTFGYYNYGTVFKPKVNGTINSVYLKLPQSDGDVVIRIWKVSTQALLKSFSVIVATNNLGVTIDTNKFPLLKDEEYVISMKVNSWFDRKKTNDTYISFPVDINNIKITGYIQQSQETFPYLYKTETRVYNGDLSFNFQQTD